MRSRNNCPLTFHRIRINARFVERNQKMSGKQFIFAAHVASKVRYIVDFPFHADGQFVVRFVIHQLGNRIVPFLRIPISPLCIIFSIDTSILFALSVRSSHDTRICNLRQRRLNSFVKRRLRNQTDFIQKVTRQRTYTSEQYYFSLNFIESLSSNFIDQGFILQEIFIKRNIMQ